MHKTALRRARDKLVGMSDRVAALQGRLELESPPGVGTNVVATLPISRGSAN
jgi:signal transduction histidine kinase